MSSGTSRPRVQRAVNVGEQPYEEVMLVSLDRPDAVPQPADDAADREQDQRASNSGGAPRNI
jgi:hypothetical protein